jgi:formylglycine-generating enzyme required for sulfatase activity
VFIAVDGHPRLANLAVRVADEYLSTEQEIQIFGQIMFSVVPGAQILSSQMSVLLSRMAQATTSGLNSWGTVLQAVKSLEPKNIPVEAMKISAQDKAAIQAVEAARKQQRRSLWINVGSLAFLFAIVVYLALRKFVFTNERQIQKMVKIPAGAYQLPSGKKVQIERDYWIDKYEVTWGQYARFLEYLDKNPTADQDFRHPKMPRYLEHESDDLRRYLGRARAGAPARSIPIDLNCPVITVSWWDAYAYAKWLGSQTGTERDLPTEEEWEIAASGDKGLKYPWGNDFDQKRTNTNADHRPNNPGEKGTVDGFNFWSPVDAISGDRSPFGVIGMGGNVAEWTGSWTEVNRFPIIKGGSYNVGATSNDKRINNHDPNKGEEWLGFGQSATLHLQTPNSYRHAPIDPSLLTLLVRPGFGRPCPGECRHRSQEALIPTL